MSLSLFVCCNLQYLYIFKLPGAVQARHSDHSSKKSMDVAQFDFVISNFLSNAKDRKGGRAARKPPNPESSQASSQDSGSEMES